MSEYYAPEIAKHVFYVGAKDPNLRKFDALVHLPHGTSYNSYLVKGERKTALIDTVAHGFEEEFLGRISRLTDINKLDYLVMNHAEADHASAIPRVMEASSAVLLTSPKGAKMAERFFGIRPERIEIVDFEKPVDLGGKTLNFIDAAWLHWPETMFTYIPEDKILFSGDFFGGHISHGIFDSDVENPIGAAKSYFAEIMLPLKNWGNKALDKLDGLDIAIIAPTHGPVYREVSPIMENYRIWCGGETLPKALIAYTTMWGGTERMAGIISESLRANGVAARLYNMGNTEFSEISVEMIDSGGLVLVTPTVLGNLHPLATMFMNIVKLYKASFKYGAIVSSYGWARSASKYALDAMGAAKIEVVGSVEVNGPPLEEDVREIGELGKKLAERILGG